jgi:putative peptidoglycan lipid II flippase
VNSTSSAAAAKPAVAARALLGAAALIAVLTVAARLAGFGRILVFNASVGTTELGDIYLAANTVPNIVFELVAGGAVASLVVPILAGPAARQDRAAVSALASALLTRVVLVLVPVAVAVAVGADPLVRVIAVGASDAQLAVGADMLRVFAPQLPLYGVGIVLTGVLQTYRRFAWPVLAPLLSSLTVIVVYVMFWLVAGRAAALDRVSDGELLILSLGTTLGVAVLSLCLLIPLRGLGLRLRPTYKLDQAVAPAVRRLAVAGAVTVGAQQLALGLSIALASYGPAGSIALYTLTQTIFLLPWAVLAVPIATSAYPALAEAGATGDEPAYGRTLAPALRILVLAACLGAAVLAGLATPLARLLVSVTADPPPVASVAGGIAGFAAGLLGYGVFALLSRALYARGDSGRAALVTALGWAAVAVSALILADAVAVERRVTALAVANSIGMTVLGAGLLAVVARRAGRAAVAGVARTLVAGVAAGVAAAAAGFGVRLLIWGGATPDAGTAVLQGMLCGVVVGAVFLVVIAVVDRRTATGLFARIRRRR